MCVSVIQLGKMYLVKEGFWLLFPTVEPARNAAVSVFGWTPSPGERNHWGCETPIVEENTYFVLLDENEHCYKLLDCNGNVGWIYCWDFSCFFELAQE